jgi:hypothetical protein
MDKFFLDRGGNNNDPILASFAGFDEPTDIYFSGETVLCTLFVPFEQLIDGPQGHTVGILQGGH